MSRQENMEPGINSVEVLRVIRSFKADIAEVGLDFGVIPSSMGVLTTVATVIKEQDKLVHIMVINDWALEVALASLRKGRSCRRASCHGGELILVS